MSHFERCVGAMPDLLEKLLSMDPVSASKVPMSAPKAGVYLFLQENQALYVGRSDNIRERIAQHRRPSSRPNVAAFAMLIARRETGRQATYETEGSRHHLMNDAEFSKAFERAKERIREMDVRYVEISDPMKQALFELYSADALNTPYNEWKTH